MKTKVFLIGIGMGNRDTLTIGALNALQNCDRIIGAQRMLDCFEDINCEKLVAVLPDDIAAHIAAHPQDKTAAVVFSGDIGFYSGAKKLYTLLNGYEVETIGGISSVSYFCAQLHTSWDDAYLVSAHGRECGVLGAVMTHAKTFFLTGGTHCVRNICRTLCENGLGEVSVSVGERLSYADERIVMATAGELVKAEFDDLSVMLVVNPAPLMQTCVTHGMEDGEFIRSSESPVIPMTKSEVRSVSLSKLRLEDQHIIYDIGAGTGSVAVEAALQVQNGFVYAIEKNAAALKLIEQNKAKFGLHHLTAVSGIAPQALAELPPPDRAFIGGSCGNMEAILAALLAKNPRVRVVVNAIALETVGETLACFHKFGLTGVDIAQISVSKAKAVSNYSMMTGQNPVFVISGQGAGL
nr:precorrin-6y C5,15-methyltransferase (decarboxylating) subunit CbiE [uncultured Caproiciproducens sp.]